jgi:hypothetical protein
MLAIPGTGYGLIGILVTQLLEHQIDALFEGLLRLVHLTLFAGLVLIALGTVALLLFAAYAWSVWLLIALAGLLLVWFCVQRSRCLTSTSDVV